MMIQEQTLPVAEPARPPTSRTDQAGDYVHYGCLYCAPESWLNFDASPTLRFERIPILGRLYSKNERRFPPNVRYGDIVKGLPVRPGSCRALYCSHVLEHLALMDCRKALSNSYSYLRPGGAFRMVLPDLETLARTYLNDGDWNAAHRFMEQSMLGFETRSRGVRGLLLAWMGNSRHLWMWDFKSLGHELEQAGFRQIRRACYGDAGDDRFHEVEDRGRFEGCLAIECTR
jgi:hypothetical protein